jgi:trimeric autotransporter adhesin
VRKAFHAAKSGLIALVAILLVASPTAFAQAPGIHYVYDELGRLTVVVDQQGNGAVYIYDATGNLLQIDRFDASGQPGNVAISHFTPIAGKIGTTVQVFGKGLAPGSSVSFNGTSATVFAAAPNRLQVTVPSGATTGPIGVTSTLGSATSATSFRIVGPLALSPAWALVRVTKQVQFSATDGGAATTNVRWAVNGITGGDPSIGTITNAGVFTAPANVPFPAVVTVSATHLDDSTLTVSASVTIDPPLLVVMTPPSVSVVITPVPTSDKAVNAAVSVALGAPPALGSAVLTSVSFEPVITSIAPASSGAGTTVSVTFTGRGLTGASGLSFLRNNSADGTVTATNIVVNPEGTQLTADLTVDAGAPSGSRVVRVTTSAGTSTALGMPQNVFSVP